MKCVMLSIRPKYCELIANGKKTVEVRKTKPKIDVPFKCYIYCTKGEHLWKTKDRVFLDGNYNRLLDDLPDYLLDGKVIGEFVCDKVVQFENDCYTPAFEETADLSCVGYEGLYDYLGAKEYGYGWHITDLVIYDKPKELSEFTSPEWFRDCEKQCPDMERMRCPVGDSRKADKICGWCRKGGEPIKRPFQSWGYVEELKGETE